MASFLSFMFNFFLLHPHVWVFSLFAAAFVLRMNQNVGKEKVWTCNNIIFLFISFNPPQYVVTDIKTFSSRTYSMCQKSTEMQKMIMRDLFAFKFFFVSIPCIIIFPSYNEIQIFCCRIILVLFSLQSRSMIISANAHRWGSKSLSFTFFIANLFVSIKYESILIFSPTSNSHISWLISINLL